MSGYYELCRCGHTRYYHVWVPDPATFDGTPERTDCAACCCGAFDGTGKFDLSESPVFGSPHGSGSGATSAGPETPPPEGRE